MSLVLAACNPGLFKKPAKDMLESVKTLRDVYFDQLRVRRQADAESVVATVKQSFWYQPDLAKNAGTVNLARTKIADAKALPLLPEAALKVRQSAFDALEAYAGTLTALASEDDAESVADELKGLVSDIDGIVKQAKSIGALASFAGKADAWLGPLGNVVEAFTQIIRLVSNVQRTAAIRNVVYTAHRPIKELLELLREEAIYARNDTLKYYDRSIDEVDKALAAGIRNSAAVPEAVEYAAGLHSARDSLKRMPAIEDSFSAAIRAQDALHQKVGDPNVGDLVAQVRGFRDQVRATKAAFQAIR